MRLPSKYEIRYKEFLRLREEQDEIQDKIEDLPWIPYDKPIHKGWEVNYELRDDIARRGDSDYIKEVLRIGYSTSLIRSIKHVKMMRRGIKGYWSSYGRGRYWTSFTPGKIRLKEQQYQKLIPPIQKYFHKPRWWEEGYNIAWRDHYFVSLPSYWLTLRVRPHYHTHFRDKDGALETRYKEIECKLRDCWRVFGQSYGKSYPAHKDRARVRNCISKFKSGEIEDIPNEKIPLIYEF